MPLAALFLGTTLAIHGFDGAVSDNATDGAEAIGDHGC